VNAPDYIEPIVGWRFWHVVEAQGGLRLRSPLYRTLWVPRQELVAACRRGAESSLSSYWPAGHEHFPPSAQCRCGICASRTAAETAAYSSRCFKQGAGVFHRVIGRVSLWGTVVECERGWRASHAYPAQIYVPTPKRCLLSFGTGTRRPSLPAEEIAWGLADYGVPVEVVDCTTVREVAESLDLARQVPPPERDRSTC